MGKALSLVWLWPLCRIPSAKAAHAGSCVFLGSYNDQDLRTINCFLWKSFLFLWQLNKSVVKDSLTINSFFFSMEELVTMSSRELLLELLNVDCKKTVVTKLRHGGQVRPFACF